MSGLDSEKLKGEEGASNKFQQGSNGDKQVGKRAATASLLA